MTREDGRAAVRSTRGAGEIQEKLSKRRRQLASRRICPAVEDIRAKRSRKTARVCPFGYTATELRHRPLPKMGLEKKPRWRDAPFSALQARTLTGDFRLR